MEVIEQETGSAKKKELQEKLEQTETHAAYDADIISEELIERISEEYDQLKRRSRNSRIGAKRWNDTMHTLTGSESICKTQTLILCNMI